MPKPKLFTSRTRETKEIHASWWSPKRTADGNPHSPEVGADEEGHYVERAVIYAQQFGKDTQAIQARTLQNVNLQRVGEPKSANELARSRMYTFQRMVVEITDEDGNPQRIDENFMATTEEYDLKFIADEIEKLSQSPLEPTEEDKADHDRDTEKYEQLVNQDYPEHLRHLRTVEQVAQDNFRPRL
jgi:hypothetical protein